MYIDGDMNESHEEDLADALAEGIETGKTITITAPSNSTIGENIAKGIAIAQAAVHTTGFDRKNEFSKYKYTGLGTIFAMARHACQQGQISFRIGRTWIDWSASIPMLHGIVSVSHVSGECLPDYETSMAIVSGKKPFDKGLLVARTVMRRYAVSDFLGMGWDEAGDDIDQRDDREYEPPPKLQLQDRSNANWGGRPGPTKEGIENAERKNLARAAVKNLKGILGDDASNEQVYSMALGMSEIPKPTTIEILDGLIHAWNVCSTFTTGAPTSHKDLLSSAEELGEPLKWQSGNYIAHETE